VTPDLQGRAIPVVTSILVFHGSVAVPSGPDRRAGAKRNVSSGVPPTQVGKAGASLVTEIRNASDPDRPALSRELSEFLVELSIGVHRHAMYPTGHPSLTPVVENIVGRLAKIFEVRGTLSIGVAQRQLVIEGVATHQGHPVLSDLARRLHDHQLSALSLEKGIRASEVSGLLASLAQETERGGTPLGLLPPEEAPRWEHAKLYRVGYERLEITEPDDPTFDPERTDRATALWLGLAQAALASEEPLEAVPDAAEVARSISEHRKESAYDQVIVGYLLQLAGELKGAQGADSEKVRRRVSRLIDALDADTLGRLVQFGGDRAQRRRFLLDSNQSLAVESVVKVLTAAARSSEQSISTSMTRLLSKLAAHAEHGSQQQRSQADTALRENIEALISGWDLQDPNPEAYTNVLDAIARAAPVFESAEETVDPLSGAMRIVDMALEMDAWGPTVASAAAAVVADGGIDALLEVLADAPPDSSVARTLRGHLMGPEELRRILSLGRVSDEGLRTLFDAIGDDAIDPLLDVLADAEDRTVRRHVFKALSSMGSVVGPRAVSRLSDKRWFVQRNMLALLARLTDPPEDFDPQPFMEHPDMRVRREAFPLALGLPRLRDKALVGSLTDTDERVVRMALLELRQGVPDPVLPTLVNRVVKAEERSPDIRALAVKALAASRSTLAFKTLLDLVTAGKTLFGRTRLARPTPQTLHAFRGLAQNWADRDEVKRILRAAARSKDPAICDALFSEGEGEGA